MSAMMLLDQILGIDSFDEDHNGAKIAQARRFMSFIDDRTFNICIWHWQKINREYSEYSQDTNDYCYPYLYYEIVHGLKIKQQPVVHPLPPPIALNLNFFQPLHRRIVAHVIWRLQIPCTTKIREVNAALYVHRYSTAIHFVPNEKGMIQMDEEIFDQSNDWAIEALKLNKVIGMIPRQERKRQQKLLICSAYEDTEYKANVVDFKWMVSYMLWK